MVIELDRTATSDQLTPAALWQAAAGAPIGDELLEWPPDLVAVTHLV